MPKQLFYLIFLYKKIKKENTLYYFHLFLKYLLNVQSMITICGIKVTVVGSP